jgi:HK97 family phage portal protein
MASPSLNAENKPSWIARRLRGIAATFFPELHEQEQGGPAMTRYGVVRTVKTKSGGSQFGEISGGNQFVIERPSGTNPIDAARAIENNKGFVYASVNAKAREVMAIDWRLFQVNGDDHEEKKDHDILDLLDAPNDSMNGLKLKYLLSACLDLAGNSFLYLEGVKNELAPPKAIHLMPADKVKVVIDRRSWPYQVLGYSMRLETKEYTFKPYEVIHFDLPNASDYFNGYSPVMAGAEYIDNDNYAMEFNRKFFVNGARPAGFLETDFVAETQLESLKIGFMDAHGGIDNMNKLGVLPKGVKWAPTGANPKDMDFKNMSEDMRDRILAMFGVSRTILGTAESDTNRACYDDQTEVLTENGWKKYYQVKDGEKIAEYDGENNVVRFAVPLGKYVYPYKGKMLHFENCKMDIMVTPDHRMWYRPDHKGAKYRIGFAEDLPKICYFKAAAPQNDGESIDLFSLPYYEKGSRPENKSRNFMMDDWLEFLGYVISEGGVSSQVRNRVITLYQKKQPHQNKIRACLKRLKATGCINYGEYQTPGEDGARFNVYGAPVIFWMHDFIGGYANEKHLPDFVFKLCRRQRQILFDALMLGDGSISPRPNDRNGYYSTTSHQLAEDVQRLAFSLGIEARAAIHYEASGNRHTCYRVSLDFGTAEQQLDFQHRPMRSEVDYDGVVWCFKTATGLFVTRRNGKIALQGNTAETADYVFSKRVVKPHMMLICAVLNDRLVPRYGDDLYISFIDPVPEDKAFRVQEMQAAMGSQPLLTANEGRESYLGRGPVEGGDTLMAPTAMAPVGTSDGNADPAPQPENDPNAKRTSGPHIAYRPPRTKLQKLAKKRVAMRESLTEKIKADLKKRLDFPTKKFVSTKEQDETRWKEWSDYVRAAEKDIANTVQKINADQKAEVLSHLPGIVGKAINPGDLFDVKKWISITTDALNPIMETLFVEQAKLAGAEVQSTFDFTQATREAIHQSVQMMSESYQQTTLNVLEAKINDGLQAGESLADITKTVEEVYEWSDESRAAMVAKTESFRTANSALKSAWQQSGVVKTVRWYTSEKDNVCPYCLSMDGKVISIDDDFFKNGDSLTVGEGDEAKTMSLDYGDVSAPPLHVLCACFIRPQDVSLD